MVALTIGYVTMAVLALRSMPCEAQRDQEARPTARSAVYDTAVCEHFCGCMGLPAFAAVLLLVRAWLAACVPADARAHRLLVHFRASRS